MSRQHPHFAHVREHLERVRDGYSFIPHPESIYLGGIRDDHFWELIGLRLQGCPVVVLAALRFWRGVLARLFFHRDRIAPVQPAPQIHIRAAP